MNDSKLTIRWKKNPDGSTEISVCGEVDSYPYFKEAFLSLDILPSVHSVDERETSGESAGNSATVSLLRSLIEIIRKSNKINGHIITEQERNSKFPLTDLITIRKFTQISGIKIDERKFRNRREFRMYVQSLLKEDQGKEGWR